MSKAKNEKLQETITSLLADRYYFFGEFSLFINYEENNTIPTAGVTIDPKIKRFKYLYNNEFINSLTKEELRFLQMHEICHIISNHIRRVELNEYDPMLSNIAQDMIINKHLIEMVKDDETVKMIEGGLILPNEYKGEMFFDDVYRWLENEQKKLQQEQKNENKEHESNVYSNSKSDIQKGIDANKNKSKLKQQVKNLEKLKDVLLNENYKFDEHLPVNDEISEQDRHNLVDEIISTLKHKGSISSNLEQIIKNLDVRKPKTNIFKRIKKSIERSSIGIEKSKTYQKQNRRLPGVLKGSKRSKIKFNVILDTSGSMSNEFEKIL